MCRCAVCLNATGLGGNDHPAHQPNGLAKDCNGIEIRDECETDGDGDNVINDCDNSIDDDCDGLTDQQDDDCP